MDFNARIDHKLNDKISTYLIGYYGHDNFKIGQREFEANDENSVGVNGQPNTNSSKVLTFMTKTPINYRGAIGVY